MTERTYKLTTKVVDESIELTEKELRTLPRVDFGASRIRRKTSDDKWYIGDITYSHDAISIIWQAVTVKKAKPKSKGKK
jgi:hypothetical protein